MLIFALAHDQWAAAVLLGECLTKAALWQPKLVQKNAIDIDRAEL